MVYLPIDASEIEIRTVEVNRPGLQMAGFFELFDPDRMQIFGKSEYGYLAQFNKEDLVKRLRTLFSYRPITVVITRGLEVFPEMIELAREFEVPLLSTEINTSEFLSSLIAILNIELAPRTTQHGVLVEVYGEGILITGESGVGKSETAMELLKRGHRLVADDAVEIRRVSARTLVGSSPENIRHFMELRGVGIINVRHIFGMGAVKVTEQIDLIIQMEPWDQKKTYERMGVETEYTEILGNQVPCITIPVKTGRNLAVIIEVAAMNHRQKTMGHNAATELLAKLGMIDDIPAGILPSHDWEKGADIL